MDPKVSVKVSRECSTIFSSVNTSQVGRGMSRERNERPVESKMEGIRKSSIYQHCYSNLKRKKKKERKEDSGTGTTLTGTGTAGRKWANLGFVFPILNPFHIPTPPLLYKINPNLIFPLTKANHSSSISSSVSISLIWILLSSSH